MSTHRLALYKPSPPTFHLLPTTPEIISYTRSEGLLCIPIHRLLNLFTRYETLGVVTYEDDILHFAVDGVPAWHILKRRATRRARTAFSLLKRLFSKWYGRDLLQIWLKMHQCDPKKRKADTKHPWAVCFNLERLSYLPKMVGYCCRWTRSPGTSVDQRALLDW